MSVEGERKERLQGDGGRGQACDIWPSYKHGPPSLKLLFGYLFPQSAKNEKNNKGHEQVPEATARETRMGRQSQVILPFRLC